MIRRCSFLPMSDNDSNDRFLFLHPRACDYTFEPRPHPLNCLFRGLSIGLRNTGNTAMGSRVTQGELLGTGVTHGSWVRGFDHVRHGG